MSFLGLLYDLVRQAIRFCPECGKVWPRDKLLIEECTAPAPRFDTNDRWRDLSFPDQCRRRRLGYWDDEPGTDEDVEALIATLTRCEEIATKANTFLLQRLRIADPDDITIDAIEDQDNGDSGIHGASADSRQLRQFAEGLRSIRPRLAKRQARSKGS